jgi:aryl-phospho-beta-D-glucosidase BglC (GH1 family)
MSPGSFKSQDIQVLAEEWGANLIRWQLNMQYKISTDIETNIQRYDSCLQKKLNELDSVLIVCNKYDIKVVIDLHSTPGDMDEKHISRLFYIKQYNDCFIKVWHTIAQRYKGNPAVWGYDLINEPVQDNSPPEGMDNIQTEIRASEAIRKIDTETAIIFAVIWDSPYYFRSFSPVPISNVIYEVHMYDPTEFTHQGIYNHPVGIRYPGNIGEKYYDKTRMEKFLKPVRDFQLNYNVPIYVGEFSAIRWAPGAAQYLQDCIDLFEEYGWNWTYHAYREWAGWSVEYENGLNNTETPILATKNTDRKNVLLQAFAKNKKQ